jgi:Glyoxalase/Bleomycin resistance protein/Dioxygenase superfamily
MQTERLDPGVRVGHIHLRVADLNRSIAFYRDVLGFKLTADGRGVGIDAALLAAGDYHHHIALNTWDSAGGRPPPPGHTGLYNWHSSIRIGGSLAAQSRVCWTTATRSTTAPTTASLSPCTSPTLTGTGSSSITTARAQSGSTRTVTQSSRPTPLTPTICYPHRQQETERDRNDATDRARPAAGADLARAIRERSSVRAVTRTQRRQRNATKGEVAVPNAA